MLMPVLAEGTVRYSNVKAGLLVSLVHFYTFGHVEGYSPKHQISFQISKNQAHFMV